MHTPETMDDPNERTDRPRIVCLCGSTRFYQAFQEANYRETMAGHIVLSVGFYPHAAAAAHGEDVGITADDKARLDQLHLRKIDIADEVLILNVDGYIGESTARELAYARLLDKPVRFLQESAGAPVSPRYRVSDPASAFAGLEGALDMVYYDVEHTGDSPDLLFLQLDDGRTIRVLSTQVANYDAT